MGRPANENQYVFRADTKVFFSKMLYELLEYVVLTVVLSAIVLVIGAVIRVKNIHDIIFRFFRKLLDDWSPFFPFSSVLLIEFFLVLAAYIRGRQKVVVSDHGIEVCKWGHADFFAYEHGDFSFSHEQKIYWKRNEIEYFMVYIPAKKKDERGEHFAQTTVELFCFSGDTVQKLQEKIRQGKKRSAGVLLDESDTELLQTKPVTIYIPKNTILEKEWKVTVWSFIGGLAACGGIAYLLFRYGEIWGQRLELRLLLVAILIFFTVTIRLFRTVRERKSVPERIYISGEYLNIDGTGFWLKDVEQIEFSEKKLSKDKSEQNRWYLKFLYKGKKKCYWLGTESSFPTIKFNQMKREIRESLALYPEKLV